MWCALILCWPRDHNKIWKTRPVTREEILEPIKLTTHDGAPLGKERSERLTGISEHEWNRYWPRLSDAQRHDEDGQVSRSTRCLKSSGGEKRIPNTVGIDSAAFWPGHPSDALRDRRDLCAGQVRTPAVGRRRARGGVD